MKLRRLFLCVVRLEALEVQRKGGGGKVSFGEKALIDGVVVVPASSGSQGGFYILAPCNVSERDDRGSVL